MAKIIDGVILPTTTGEMLASFGYACIFGACGIPAIFELKDLIPLLLATVIPLKYSFGAYTVATIILISGIWLAMFFLLWHRLETAHTNRERLLKTIRWSAIAIGIFLIAIVGHALFDVIVAST